MKRAFASIIAFAVAFALVAIAGDRATAQGKASGKTGTWTGEILDAGCYLEKGAMGPKHAECALKCASNGMPLMLLTKDGKAVLLTPNHDNPDPYEKLKGMAGSVVAVTGTWSERGGARGIDVTGVAAPAK